MNRLMLCLTLLILPLVSLSQSQRAYFEQITTANGLPENSAGCMLQDHLGFMWLGTQNGLVRYDGIRMTVYQNDPNDPYSLKNNAVNYLYEDRRGDIWVGCDGGLYRFERATQRFIQYQPGKGNAYTGRIAFIYQDKRDYVWIITEKRGLRVLHRYDPKLARWTYYEHNPAQPDGLVYTDVLIMSATGVRRACFLEDAQGDIWVVTRNGATVNSDALLHRYDRAKDQFRPWQPKEISAAHPALNYVKLPTLDRKGMIWIPTHGNGLYQINPITNQLIAHYRHNPRDGYSLVSDTVRTVYEDRSGFLWISTLYGLDRLDPQTHLFTHFPHDPNNPNTPGDQVSDAVQQTANGNIWFSTALAGVDEYDQQSGRFVRYVHNTGQGNRVSPGKASSLIVDQSDLVWVGTVGNGVYKQSKMTRFDPFDYQPAPPKGVKLPSATVVYEAPSEPGVLWIGTTEGLDRYDKKTRKRSHYALDVKNSVALGTDQVSCMVEDTKGRFWIGTTNGLYLMNRQRGTFTRLGQDPTNANTLNLNFIKTMVAARNGLLWIGTNLGLNQFDPETNRFTHYYRADTLYHPDVYRFVNSLSVPPRQIVAAWHKLAGDSRYATQTFTLSGPTRVAIAALGAITAAQKSEYGWIEDTQGRIIWEMDWRHTRFAGGQDYRMQIETLPLAAGTYRLQYRGNDGSARATFNVQSPTPYHPELRGIQVLRLTAPEADTLTRLARKWVYTGLGSAVISVVHEDKMGRIWIGTGGGGLNRYDPETNQFTVYREPMNGLQTITSLYEEPNSHFWVGDYLHGFFFFDPVTGATKRFTTANGLSHNSVMSIVPDNTGHLWLSTFKGLSRFDHKTKRFRSYTGTEGPESLIFRYPSFKSADGRIFFPGDHGISTLEPHQLFDDLYPPRVVLTDVSIFNQKAAIGTHEPLLADVSMADKITLAHNQNELTFSFAALYYNRTSECRYAFKLEPYDTDWIQAGTAQQARYTTLPPGTYTFSVKAANADGLWNNKATSIRVIVLPPWWRTWLAYSLYALLIGGGIWGVMQYRSRILRRENQLLEEKVTERTEQLKRKSSELEHSLVELKTTQTQLIQREKMASLGELTAGIAHEIQNPLNFVNNFSEVSVELVEELKEEVHAGRTTDVLTLADDLSQNLQRITQNGQRASNIVRGMLEHSRSSTGERQPTDLNVLCDECLRLAYHGTRSKNQVSTCQLETHFDPALPLVSVVASDLSRVLLNLFNNAFYAVNQKQKMALADETYLPTVWVSSHRLSTKVEIRVRDNGPGIPDAIKEKIFQPFFTTKPTGEGTGLGLSLSYDIVTKGHGGEMGVESVAGQFTEFIIHLPINSYS